MNILPLGLMKSGSSAIIKDIIGGRHMRQQLLEQDLMSGSLVRIIKNDVCGPMIISINDTRLAIGRGVSLKIMGEELTSLKNFTPELGCTNSIEKVVVEK